MPKGKGKKGKKGKKVVDLGPQPATTKQIIHDRTKMLCPRLGDIYNKSMNVETILEDVAEKYLIKVVEKQMQTLSLTAMKLKRLPDFSNMANEMQCLTSLNLSKNSLFNGDEVFLGLSLLGQLTELNISENFLNGTLSEHAGKLTNLETIILDINNITVLSPAVRNWQNLKIFSISDNALTSLPVEASGWQEVKVVNLKNNKINDIGTLPNFWPQLERLYLGSNLMTSIPFEIGTCTQLIELDFSRNAIQTLPLSMAQCTSLQRLHLGNNKIEHLPPEMLSALINLTELHLYKNKLTAVPPEIGNLSQIKKVTLSSNNIRALPEEIGACSTLEELYINNNAKFNSFPSSAGHLRLLKELSLSKCPALKQLPNTVMEMSSLKALDIRAAKKQVCKITPEVAEAFRDRFCKVRGGLVKKAKGGKKKKDPAK